MLFSLALFALAAGPAVPADVVFVGGKIWTVDVASPQVEALAVRQGRIVIAGTDAEVRAAVGPKTVVVELRGRRVIPGVYDSHVH